MANINIYKRHHYLFFHTVAVTIFEILRFQMFDLENLGHCYEGVKRHLHHSITNELIYIDYFFRILSDHQHMYMHESHEHTHTHRDIHTR